MDYRHTTCPCCGKEVDIPLGEYGTDFDYNYSVIVNSTEEFFDLVEMCPECGYVELFDNGVSDEMKEYVRSEEYVSILNNEELEQGLKKWILLGKLTEFDENYTEAGIAYMKVYDYIELKGMMPDKRFIEKAASCFLSSLEMFMSFSDAILAVDSIRRDGEFEKAEHLLEIISNTFEGEIVERLSIKERAAIDIESTDKYYLDI